MADTDHPEGVSPETRVLAAIRELIQETVSAKADSSLDDIRAAVTSMVRDVEHRLTQTCLRERASYGVALQRVEDHLRDRLSALDGENERLAEVLSASQEESGQLQQVMRTNDSRLAHRSIQLTREVTCLRQQVQLLESTVHHLQTELGRLRSEYSRVQEGVAGLADGLVGEPEPASTVLEDHFRSFLDEPPNPRAS